MKPTNPGKPNGNDAVAATDDTAATVTRLLNEAATGEPGKAAALLPLVYKQLRRLAKQKMRHESPGQTLQATELVHEAFLRVAGPDGGQQWDGRWHFFAAAAEAMRRILVDNARRRARLKRGGDRGRENLDRVELAVKPPGDDLVALNEALERLEEHYPQKAQLVKLRYFAGLTNEEAAQALGISANTADRHWAFARAWLFRQVSKG
jgi:RNA polymerase sigma factor (TIGR02999 family)